MRRRYFDRCHDHLDERVRWMNSNATLLSSVAMSASSVIPVTHYAHNPKPGRATRVGILKKTDVIDVLKSAAFEPRRKLRKISVGLQAAEKGARIVRIGKGTSLLVPQAVENTRAL